jgi:hypothetical protein
MVASPTRVVAAVASVVAGILAGILGGWLTGRWSWGAAAGVLILIAVAAGAEVVKACSESRTGGRHSHLDDRPIARLASMDIGDHATIRGSVVAAGDVDQSRTTNVRRGNAVPAAIAICALALAASTGGTIYLGNKPGGRLYTPKSRPPAALREPRPPASSSDAPPSSGASATAKVRLAATFRETDSSGDSITQTVSFGAPTPLSQVTKVAAAAEDACMTTLPGPPARDLAIPVTIISTLKSSVAVQASLALTLGNFYDSSGNSQGLGQNGIVIGSFGNGLGCDDGSGGYVTLSEEGASSSFHAWLVLPDAISPRYPTGNMAALGQTYVQLDLAPGYTSIPIDNAVVTGPGVCAGLYTFEESFMPMSNYRPYLHIGGKAYSWEQCTGHYDITPNEIVS